MGRPKEKGQKRFVYKFQKESRLTDLVLQKGEKERVATKRRKALHLQGDFGIWRKTTRR